MSKNPFQNVKKTFKNDKINKHTCGDRLFTKHENDATFIPLLCHKTLQSDYFVDNQRIVCVPINSCCLQLVK